MWGCQVPIFIDIPLFPRGKGLDQTERLSSKRRNVDLIMTMGIGNIQQCGGENTWMGVGAAVKIIEKHLP